MSKDVFVLGGLGNRLNCIMNYLGQDVVYDWNLGYGGMDLKWEDMFSHPKLPMTYTEHVDIFNEWSFVGDYDKAREFIKSLVPSDKVKALLVPKCEVGYVIRSLHPMSRAICHGFKIPDGAFLATDADKHKRYFSNTVQITGRAGRRDLDPHIRSGDGMLRAVADWWMLMQCDVIYEYGLPFVNMTETHSTFIDAHRIMGKKIINITVGD